jgi:hypothetical protein
MIQGTKRVQNIQYLLLIIIVALKTELAALEKWSLRGTAKIPNMHLWLRLVGVFSYLNIHQKVKLKCF